MVERRQFNRRSGADRRSGRNQRKNARLTISKRVDFEHEGTSNFAFTKDISSGGAFLRTSRTVPVDTELDLNFNLEGKGEPVMVRARVVRATSGGVETGIGIRFQPQGQKKALDQIASFVLSEVERKALERINRNPNDTKTLLELSEIATEKAEIERAEEYLRRIAGIEPCSLAHGYLAEIVLNRARETNSEPLYQEAYDLFSTVLRLGSDDAFGVGLETCKKQLESFRRDRQSKEQRLKKVDKQEQQLAEEKKELDSEKKEVGSAKKELEQLRVALNNERQQLEKRSHELANLSKKFEKQQQEFQERLEALARREKEQIEAFSSQKTKTKESQAKINQDKQDLASAQKALLVSQTAVEEKEKSLEARQKKLDKLAADLEKQREEFGQGHQGLQQLNEQSASLLNEVQNLKQREKRVETAREKLKQEQQQLAAEQASFQQAQNQFKRDEKKLQARTEELDLLAASLEKQGESLKKKREDLRLQNEHQVQAKNQLQELEQKSQELSKQEAALSKEEKAVEEARTDLAQQQQLLVKEQASIHAARAELTKKEDDLKSRAEDLDRRATSLERQSEALGLQHNQQAQEKALHDERQKSNDRLQKELEQRSLELATREAELDRKAKEVELARANLAQQQPRLVDQPGAVPAADEIPHRSIPSGEEPELVGDEAFSQIVEDATSEAADRVQGNAIVRLIPGIRSWARALPVSPRFWIPAGAVGVGAVLVLALVLANNHEPSADENNQAKTATGFQLNVESLPPPSFQPETEVAEAAEGAEALKGDSINSQAPALVDIQPSPESAPQPAAQPDTEKPEASESALGPGLTGNQGELVWPTDGAIEASPREETTGEATMLVRIKSDSPQPATLEKTAAEESSTTAPRVVVREKPRKPSADEAEVVNHPPAKTSLSRDDITSVVNENQSKLSVCVKAAHSGGELSDGSYSFVINWEITSSGAVVHAGVSEPESVLTTSIPTCFSKVINSWKFSASKRGGKIVNFPYGPVEVP